MFGYVAAEQAIGIVTVWSVDSHTLDGTPRKLEEGLSSVVRWPAGPRRLVFSSDVVGAGVNLYMLDWMKFLM
jgi:hypothetical protein